MAPSDWRGPQKDAGHDEMQAAVYKFIRAGCGWHLEDDGWEKTGVFVEYPFFARGKLTGFADIAVRYENKENYPPEKWLFFEIKPSVESVGALIRQCRAVAHLAKYVVDGGVSRFREFDVIAVVYDDDVKLSLLKSMFHPVWAISRDVVSSVALRVVS